MTFPLSTNCPCKYMSNKKVRPTPLQVYRNGERKIPVKCCSSQQKPGIQPRCKVERASATSRQRGRLRQLIPTYLKCTTAVFVITRARALKVLVVGSTPNAIGVAILAVACQLIHLRLPGSTFCKLIVILEQNNLTKDFVTYICLHM